MMTMGQRSSEAVPADCVVFTLSPAIPPAGTDMMGGGNGAHTPLQTPFDRKKAAAIGLRKWVRFAKNGDTTIMQVSWPT